MEEKEETEVPNNEERSFYGQRKEDEVRCDVKSDVPVVETVAEDNGERLKADGRRVRVDFLASPRVSVSNVTGCD